MQGKHNDHNFDFFLKKMKKNEKCLELPDLARKLIKKSFKFCCPPPQKIRFFEKKNEKCLELPDLGRKLIRKSFKKISPPPPKKIRFFEKKTKSA